MKHIRYWIWIYGLTSFLFILAVHSGNKAVTTISETIATEKSWTIVVDAGHGGIDTGTTSISGVPESSLNLEIAQKLDDLFSLLGYQTIMTREDDRSIHTEGETIAGKKASDLKKRVDIANSRKNTILISIHQNHFPDSRYNGAQVFYADTPGSMELAQNIQAELTGALDPQNKRKTTKAKGIYLMEHIHCTGILVECGFLSNFQEEALLRTKEYQQKICCVIAATTVRYLHALNV